MIELDPNSWLDAEWWFEDEPDVFNFMQENEVKIKEYAKKHNMTIRDAIVYLYKKGKN